MSPIQLRPAPRGSLHVLLCAWLMHDRSTFTHVRLLFFHIWHYILLKLCFWKIKLIISWAKENQKIQSDILLCRDLLGKRKSENSVWYSSVQRSLGQKKIRKFSLIFFCAEGQLRLSGTWMKAVQPPTMRSSGQFMILDKEIWGMWLTWGTLFSKIIYRKNCHYILKKTVIAYHIPSSGMIQNLGVLK